MEETNKINIDKEIEKLKIEASSSLDRMFGISEPFSSKSSRRIVDCIVSAAILEIASLNSKATKGQ